MSCMDANGITLTEAAKLLPRRGGKHVSIDTLKRWIKKGCRGVRLAGGPVGNVWYTSREALDEFRAACAARAGVQPVKTLAERSREQQRMDQELAAAGW